MIRLIYFSVVLVIVFCITFQDCGRGSKLNEAYELQKNENYVGAKKLYTELIASDPYDADYYLGRANCEIYLAESGFAVLDCEKAIKLTPQSGKAYYYYAFALYNNQQYDAACKAIHKSIQLGFTESVDKLCDITDSKMDSIYAHNN